MTSKSIQETAALWLTQTKAGHKVENLGSDEFFESIGKALLIVTKGDGKLAPAEREWVLGCLASYGASASALETLKTYEANEDLEQVISPLLQDAKASQNVRRLIIYNAFKACSADGSYDEGERAAIYKYASLLSLSEEIVEQIEQLHQDNEKLTEKKRQVLAIDEWFSH